VREGVLTGGRSGKFNGGDKHQEKVRRGLRWGRDEDEPMTIDEENPKEGQKKKEK